MVIQVDGRECQATHHWCSREYSIRQQLKDTLQAGDGDQFILAFPYCGLDETKETEVEWHLSQTALQVQACQCPCGLEFALSLGKLFPLVSKKPLELAQKGIGHGARQMLNNRSCSFYLPLCLCPLTLRSKEEDRPRIGGSQLVGLSAALDQRDAVQTYLVGSPNFGQPVVANREVEAAFSCFSKIATFFCVCQHLLQRLYSEREITSMEREVPDDDAASNLLEFRLFQMVCYLQGLLSIGQPFIVLSHIDHEQLREIDEDLHLFHTFTIPEKRQSVLHGRICLLSFLLSPKCQP